MENNMPDGLYTGIYTGLYIFCASIYFQRTQPESGVPVRSVCALTR